MPENLFKAYYKIVANEKQCRYEKEKKRERKKERPPPSGRWPGD